MTSVGINIFNYFDVSLVHPASSERIFLFIYKYKKSSRQNLIKTRADVDDHRSETTTWYR